jgi:hypothetical protein
MVFSDDDDLISQFWEEEDDDEYINDGDCDDIIAFFMLADNLFICNTNK